MEFKRTLTILRPFASTGLQDFPPRLFPALIRAAVLQMPFEMSSGDQVRDFSSAEDVSRAILKCIERKPQALIETFNLGSGRARTLRQMVEEVRDELGMPVEVIYGKMTRPENDPSHLVADITAAGQVLGWQPTTRLAYSVWELAQEMAPALPLRKPERWLLPQQANGVRAGDPDPPRQAKSGV